MEKKLAQLKDKFEADSALAEKLFSMENPADVQSLLKEQGLEFSLEEIAALKDAIVKYMAKGQSGELTDEALEDVAGGTIGFNPGIIGPIIGPIIIGPIGPPSGPIGPPLGPGMGRW